MAKTPTLLIADDETDLLEILTYDLAPLGYQIVTASDGKAALELLEKGGIDAVLSDINMPAMNGLEVLSEMNRRNLNIPFVFLTGYGDKEKAIAALRLGAMDFLDKPFDREVLRNAVRKAVELGVSLRQLDEETDRLLQNAKLTPEQADEFRKAQRAILIMKKEASVHFKKAS